MSQDPQQILRDYQPSKEFFIGIDSDGCVFDSMEIKHKECFCPPFINHFGLQRISKYAREAWEFVNLYSKMRGANRFLALIRALELLDERPEVKARGAKIPELAGLRSWMERESKLGNPTLKAELESNPDPDLQLLWDWSIDVNDTVAKIVRDVPPFPLVVECLEKLTAQGDAMVISQTPVEALEREWSEQKIASYVQVIAGQEMGTKTEHLALAAKGKYADEKILMIGDAPGDMKAAKSNDVLFFPINPGHEEKSWETLHGEALDRFFAGTYAGDYEAGLIEEFNGYLPEKASWQ